MFFFFIIFNIHQIVSSQLIFFLLLENSLMILAFYFYDVEKIFYSDPQHNTSEVASIYLCGVYLSTTISICNSYSHHSNQSNKSYPNLLSFTSSFTIKLNLSCNLILTITFIPFKNKTSSIFMISL